MTNTIDSAVARLEKEMSFIEDRPQGTITVVPFELVKVELNNAKLYIDSLEEQLSRYRKLLHNINTTPDES